VIGLRTLRSEKWPRVLYGLGQLDDLLTSGQLDASLHSLGRFSDKYTILSICLDRREA
jgi:hypothetical protein